MIGTEPIGRTPVERVTAYLDHLDERQADTDAAESGWNYGDSIHAFQTVDGAYVIGRNDLWTILADLALAEAEIRYLEPGA